MSYQGNLTRFSPCHLYEGQIYYWDQLLFPKYKFRLARVRKLTIKYVTEDDEGLNGEIIVNIGDEYILTRNLPIPELEDSEAFYPMIVSYSCRGSSKDSCQWNLIAVFRRSSDRDDFIIPPEPIVERTIRIECTRESIILHGIDCLPPVFRYGTIIPRSKILLMPSVRMYLSSITENPHLQISLLQIIQEETLVERKYRLYFLCRYLGKKIAIFDNQRKQLFLDLKKYGYNETNFLSGLMFEFEGNRTSMNNRDVNWFENFLMDQSNNLDLVTNLLVRNYYYREVRNIELERKYLILYYIFASTAVHPPDLILDHYPSESKLKTFFDRINY